METLPPDLWKTIFGLIPAHQFAARCTCRAWRARLGEKPARISPQTILEAGGDAEWLKTVTENWDARKANELLWFAAQTNNKRGAELAQGWGATDRNWPLYWRGWWSETESDSKVLQMVGRKIRNSMLYCRARWAADPEFRTQIAAPDESTTPLERLHQGGRIWRELPPASKERMRAEYAGWRAWFDLTCERTKFSEFEITEYTRNEKDVGTVIWCHED